MRLRRVEPNRRIGWFVWSHLRPNTGSLDMSIANPGAIAMLDEGDIWVMLTRLARGRRSDAEIAMIEKLLAERRGYMGREWDRAADARDSGDSEKRRRFYDERLWTLDRDGYIAAHSEDLVKKLARARGLLDFFTEA